MKLDILELKRFKAKKALYFSSNRLANSSSCLFTLLNILLSIT